MKTTIANINAQQALLQRRLDHYNEWLMDNNREVGIPYPGFPESEEPAVEVKPAKNLTTVVKSVKDTKAKKVKGAPTKKEQAAKIFARVGGLKNPAIMAFITELDMTRAGASSYFYAIKGKK